MSRSCPDCFAADGLPSGKCPQCGGMLLDENVMKTGFRPAGSTPLLFGRFDAEPRKRADGYESYSGLDCTEGRPVFIKRAVKPGTEAAPVFDMLAHEADVLSRLDHPLIAKILEVRRGDNEIVLILDLAPGRDLNETVRADGPLSAGDLVAIGLKAVEALNYTFQRGFLHNDIKPANLLWDGIKSFKLVDFGLATELLFGEAGTDTRGTLPYMSPERVLEGRIGIPSEIYALGATLYHLAVGRPPFWSGDIRSEILEKAPPAIRDARPAFPSALEAMILKCLHKNPKKRWPDFEEAGAALKESGREGSPVSPSERAGDESATRREGEDSFDRLLALLSEARMRLTEFGDRSSGRIVKDLENRVLDWKLALESRTEADRKSGPDAAGLAARAESLLAAVLAGRKAEIGTLAAGIARAIDHGQSRI